MLRTQLRLVFFAGHSSGVRLYYSVVMVSRQRDTI